VEGSAERSVGRSRPKLKIQLSEDEYAELHRAAVEAEFPNMALLVFQAIQAGLESDQTRGIQRKRTRILSIHVSKEFTEKVRLRARMSRVTQQALLRGLLFHYIRNKRWQTVEADATNQTAV
jgi:hypothetical protein